MDTSDAGLSQEIVDATKLRKDYLTLYTERLLKLVGNKYNVKWKTKAQLENASHQYMAFMLPQLVAERPIVEISPLSDARDTMTCEGMAAQINGFIQCSQYKKRVLTPCARDMLMGWGVTMAYLDFASIDAQQGNPVNVKTIPIGQYLCDAQCFGYENRRWEGHSFDRPKDQVLADPRYVASAEIINAIPANDTSRKRDDLPVQREPQSQRNDMLTLWEIWLRDTNEIVTMIQTDETSGRIIRREPYDGPPEGPYTLWGVYEVPGQIYPLSPLGATEEQEEDLNDHAYAAMKSAKTHKRFGVYRKASSSDGKEVQTVKSGQMIGLDDPNSVKDMEIGGMSAVQEKVLSLLRDRLDRNRGFTDAQRGMATGKATLGENELAQGNADAKTGFIRDCLTACAEENLGKVGWFFFNKAQIVQNVMIENQQGQKDSYQMLGGKTDPDELETYIAAGLADPSQRYSVGKEWMDYHLRIQVESMVRVADPIRQKRAQDEVALVSGLFNLAAAAFGPPTAWMMFNWKRILRRYGQAFNETAFDAVTLTPMFDQVSSPDSLAMMALPPGGQPSIGQPNPGAPPQGNGALLPSGSPIQNPPSLQQPSQRTQASPSPSPSSRPGLMRNMVGGVTAGIR